ncbi:MAG: G8 domain-containing protein, partial [Flavobacteriales bacterium]
MSFFDFVRRGALLFFVFFFTAAAVLADPISAVADGDWDDPMTWDGGLVPGFSDQVTIPAGITVELSGTHSAQTLTVNGTLRAAGDASVDLSAEWVMVMGPGALFEVGTPTAPFPAEHDFTLTLTGANTGASMMGMGEKFLGAMNGGQIELHGAPKVSWTRLGASSFLGANQLTLADPVDWQPGDEIVVVSSRINWAEAEQRTLNAVSADGLTLTLNVGLLMPHLSTVETHTRDTDGKTWTADMRAEVGLLTHNVKVQGDATSEVDGFGGHIMIMPGSVGNASHIELFRMGQKAELGRYPWHWHLLHETGLGQSFKHSSVHRSFNRALTIHGTSYVEVTDNFFYDHIGHGLFLEDGSERYNSILNNVVVASKRPAPGEEVTPSDNQFNEVQNRTPASFWITNPNNIFEGNVAAGTEGTGYWFALPQAPMGSSAGNPLFDGIEPFREPLGSFVGNTAHSCMSGFDIFDQLFPDHSIRKNAGWQETGEHLIDGCTWYANSLAVYSGIGGAVGDNVTYTANLKFSDNIFVANATAIQLASYSQVVESAIVAHAQANYIAGMASLYRIYDGAGQIRDCHLVGWSALDADYLKDGGAATKHTNHRVSGITTDDGLPPRVDMRDYDIPPSPTDMTPQSLSHPRVWNMVLLDEDGSLTGTAGHSVVSNHPMMRVGDEVQPSNWVNAFISPHRFDLGVLEFPDLPQGDIPNVTCTRTKTGTPTESVYYIHGYKEHIQLPLIVNEGYLYSYQFESLPATREMVVELDDAEAGDALWIRLVGLGDLGGLTIGSPDFSLVEMGTLLDLANSPQAGYFVEPGGDIYLNVTATGRLQQVGLAWDVDVVLPPLDTDGDGVSDGDEIANGTDPFATDVDVSGCTYVGACNYNPDADVEDG